MNTPLVVAFAVAGVAWFTGAGVSVRSVSRIWLRHWAERRLRGAAADEASVERPQRLVLAAATGTAITLIAGGLALGAAPGPASAGTARILFAAVAVLVFGQALPRAIARRWPSQAIPFLVPPLRLLDLAGAPVVAAARRLASRARGGATPELAPRPHAAVEELLREGELEGVGERDEIAIISGVLHFTGKTLADVMTPRAEIFALDTATPPDQFARAVAEAGYSRVPVFSGSLDDVVGVAHAFDVLRGAPTLRPVGTAPPHTACSELLATMLRSRRHLTIVRENAHTVGLVTLEDLLEELVGDIRDEHDDPATDTAGPHHAPAPNATP